MELLYRTLHGSHLYGLAHEESDLDYFEVYGWDKFRGKQKVKDGLDITRQSFDRFMLYCAKGVPQYLEAMWSPNPEVNRLPFNRFLYRPNLTETRETYRRTIKNFWLDGWEEDNFKKRRHAVRLWLNLVQMEERGFFSPTLTECGVRYCTKQANNENFGKHRFLDEME